jgi:hypothetical protein
MVFSHLLSSAKSFSRNQRNWNWRLSFLTFILAHFPCPVRNMLAPQQSNSIGNVQIHRQIAWDVWRSSDFFMVTSRSWSNHTTYTWETKQNFLSILRVTMHFAIWFRNNACNMRYTLRWSWQIHTITHPKCVQYYRDIFSPVVNSEPMTQLNVTSIHPKFTHLRTERYAYVESKASLRRRRTGYW